MVHFACGLLADSAVGAGVVPHHMAIAAALPVGGDSGRGSFCVDASDFVPAGAGAARPPRDLGAQENPAPITPE